MEAEKSKKRFGWSCNLLVVSGNKNHGDVYRFYEFIGGAWSVAADMEEKKYDAKNVKIFTVEITEATPEDLEIIKKITEELGDL